MINYLFNCFYNANIKRIIHLLRVYHHECYKALQDLHKYISGSIVKSLQQQGQDVTKTLVVTLCNTPKQSIEKKNCLLHFLLETFKKNPGLMLCSNLDKSHACTSEKRYVDADITVSMVYSFIRDKDNKYML